MTKDVATASSHLAVGRTSCPLSFIPKSPSGLDPGNTEMSKMQSGLSKVGNVHEHVRACMCVCKKGAPFRLLTQSILYIVLSCPHFQKACGMMEGSESQLCGHGQVTLSH